MSLVASFVEECTRSGRWVRGIMALHGSIDSNDPLVDRARIRLSTIVIGKSWRVALGMMRCSDACHVGEMGAFLYECARSTDVPLSVWTLMSAAVLRGAERNSRAQNFYFLSAAKWTAWHHAVQLFGMLPSPEEESRRKLFDWLTINRAYADADKVRSLDLALIALRVSAGQGGALEGRNRPTGVLRSADAPLCLAHPGPDGGVSMTGILSLARAAMQGKHVSWRLPLFLLGGHRVVDGASDCFVTMIGVCCPQHWAAALRHLEPKTRTALWLASRHCWVAGLSVSKAVDMGNSEKYDILRGCAVPAARLEKLRMIRGARQRVPAPTRAGIARALADGYVLEELQLSAFGKACRRSGRWELSLHLLDRVNTDEFQRYAIQCLFAHNKGITWRQALQLVGERRPACTSVASMLIKHSGGWLEALGVLHHLIKHGARCNPQVLSAILDTGPPAHAISEVIRRLGFATNKGIDRKLGLLEETKDT
ncbi:hypothetical protein TRVL_10247 [Trypanosoma vivax]|nr:hypothetical protein TRVL_10247 [Trypanosoma vivax]